MFMMNTHSDLFRTKEELQADGYTLQGRDFLKTTVHAQDRRPSSAHRLPPARNSTDPNPHPADGDLSTPSDPDQPAIGPAVLDQPSADLAALDQPAAGPAASERYLPLFEAKMIHQFDHRWATYHNAKFQEATTSQKQDPAFVTLPRYWVPQSEVSERVAASRTWLLAWRDITNSTNMRTWIMSLHPAAGAGHTLLQMIHRGSDSSTSRTIGMLHGVYNSFVADFVAWQKIGGTHMPFFTTKQLPVLPPEMIAHDFIADRVLELGYTAWDMTPFARHMGYNGPPFRWDDERRALIKGELDALMFHLYGINHEDAAYIMDTFPIVKRKDEQEHGEYRTKRLILECYEAMTAAFKANHGSQVDTPNGPNSPSDQQTLTNHRLAQALAEHYLTNVDPPPAHPTQAHPTSTCPA